MNQSRDKRIDTLNGLYLNKDVQIRKGCLHPHAGEIGVVIGFDLVAGLGKLGMRVKSEKGEFFVFNWNTQILINETKVKTQEI